ncbi:hypothetical protein [Nannocystis punicea]|uniref:Uncharacterized protein n=1 Tax=Nannocystis punicea TaxID=2995304 RepID=A0ABY7HAA3_9BACT|nr:hypothetical protein [Nannocystis poenicansa]WAS96035.1 hypothetical protein O0S08_07710 [Nannocystis poenicansa]
MSSRSLKARIVCQEIEATVIHCIARDLDVPIHAASVIRRLFLVEGCAGEPLCVEVFGSAHHTPTGERGEPDLQAPAPPTERHEEDLGEAPQDMYLNDGVLASVAAGLVRPVGGPFKRNRSSKSIYRYMRLTATGRILAAQYIRMEAAAKARKLCLAATPFEDQVKQDHRDGRLSLKSPKPSR